MISEIKELVLPKAGKGDERLKTLGGIQPY
jgi:hypothetical protein